MASSTPKAPSRFTQGAAADLLSESLIETALDVVPNAHPAVAVLFPEVQNAIWAAQDSAGSALLLASVTNRLIKTVDNKSLQGRWANPAVDLLRSALLFASAGLDTSLKRLVKHGLPLLLDVDPRVESQFQKWAADAMSGGQNGGLDPKALVRVLMTKGVSPRDSLLSSWIYELTDGSAQSAERVDALASALGVTDATLRARTSSPKNSKTVLQYAFTARNQIAHELDVTDPTAETRQRLERIRRYRRLADISLWSSELLEVTQLITNDVAERLTPAG